MNQSPMVYLSHERDALLYLSALADKYGVIPMSCIALSSSTVTAETFTRFEQDGLFSREEGCFRFTALGMAVVRQFTAERELQKAMDTKLAEQQAREDQRHAKEQAIAKRDRWITRAIALASLAVAIIDSIK